MGPWLSSSVADLGLSPEINFELLAPLKPDLIVMSPFVEQLELVLRRIAPTWNLVGLAHAAPSATPARTDSSSARLGRAAEAEYVADAERRLDDTRRHLGARPKRPVLRELLSTRVTQGTAAVASTGTCSTGWPR
jgi:iron complex transport system substrate-binding protein